MSDDTTKSIRSADEQPLHTHFCEHPGCTKWGGFGYDVEMGQTQWFCVEHRWNDYRLGRSRMTWPEMDASNFNATEITARTASVR